MDNLAPAGEWLHFADEDFGFASSSLDDPNTTYFGMICFHYQQAAEKYLKAYIVANNLKFEKIHDNGTLVKICAGKDEGFMELRGDADFLSDFYVDTRYPVAWPVGFTREDAEKAKISAARIGDFVKKKLAT